MADEGFKRRLSAILSADVKGYSRMMRDGEDATIRTGSLSMLEGGRQPWRAVLLPKPP